MQAPLEVLAYLPVGEEERRPPLLHRAEGVFFVFLRPKECEEAFVMAGRPQHDTRGKRKVTWLFDNFRTRIGKIASRQPVVLIPVVSG